MLKKNCESRIAVSVKCATYNHAPYIRQCLNGFVMQITNFKFEVIVHDDASTDGTTEIIKEYAEKYPTIIKPLFERENQYSKNVAAMNDAINSRLIGEYVSLCEGDDYWIDPFKLQKQFDYMEAHPEHSLCFHPNYRLYYSGKMLKHYPRFRKTQYKTKDVILGGGAMMATNSMFFRRKDFLSFNERPAFWKEAPIGDVPLRLYLSTKGDIGYIDEIMSVYRKEVTGSWTNRNKSLSVWLDSMKKNFRMYGLFDEYTNKHYHLYVLIKKSINVVILLRGIMNSIVK